MKALTPTAVEKDINPRIPSGVALQRFVYNYLSILVVRVRFEMNRASGDLLVTNR